MNSSQPCSAPSMTIKSEMLRSHKMKRMRDVTHLETDAGLGAFDIHLCKAVAVHPPENLFDTREVSGQFSNFQSSRRPRK